MTEDWYGRMMDGYTELLNRTRKIKIEQLVKQPVDDWVHCMIHWTGEGIHLVSEPMECSKCFKLICKKCYFALGEDRRFCRTAECREGGDPDEPIKTTTLVN